MNSAIKKPRLLVIEDNADTRGIYKDVFEREGFSVLLAEDGEIGLSYAQATLPDVILLDLMLPKVSGFNLLTQLRAQPETHDIPVMLFSARDSTPDLKRAAEFGVIDFATKSLISPKQMVGRVQALMARAIPLVVTAPGPELFQVSPQPMARDASRLQALLGLSESFGCSLCQGRVVMEMLADATRPAGKWFAAHFVCSTCHHAF